MGVVAAAAALLFARVLDMSGIRAFDPPLRTAQTRGLAKITSPFCFDACAALICTIVNGDWT